jgi:hypothetical protein
VFEEDVAFIFAGYHREEGTLNSIEKFDFKNKKIEKMDLIVPSSIRRFAAIKISTTKILLIGGLTKTSQESDAVFCFDLEKDYTIE